MDIRSIIFLMHKTIVSAVVFTATILFSWSAAAQTDRPAILTIVNAASYSSGPIAPGDMVLLVGTAMGPSDAAGFQVDEQGRVSQPILSKD